MEMAKNLNDYKVLISTLETESGTQFLAEYREFEFCSGGGETVEEAVKEARENLEIYIEELEAMGKPVPAPFKDEEYEYSGKFTLRMSKRLHKKAAQIAENEGVSLNSIIVEAVAEYVGSAPTSRVVEKLEVALTKFTNVVIGTSEVLNAIDGFTQRTINEWGNFYNTDRYGITFVKKGDKKYA